MRSQLLFAAAIALLPITVPAASQAQTAGAGETALAGAEAIPRIKDQWAELVAARDADAIGQLYAEDAVLMAPNETAVVGREAITERWMRQLTLPDLAFTLMTEQLVVSASNDLAYDRGTYDFAATLPSGPITDTGKYVIVWQKVDGDWKVISDIFNSNPAPSMN